jgi:hypothetical protein
MRLRFYGVSFSGYVTDKMARLMNSWIGWRSIIWGHVPEFAERKLIFDTDVRYISLKPEKFPCIILVVWEIHYFDFQ